MNFHTQTSKKRKLSSFANDRLKRLRTSLNEEVDTSTSNTTPKKEIVTTSVKHNIYNNPSGYPERKKIVPVRKLKHNANEKNTQNSNEIQRKDTAGIAKETLSTNIHNSGQNKGNCAVTLDSLKRKIIENTSTSSISPCPAKKPTPVQRDNTAISKKSNTLMKNNMRPIPNMSSGPNCSPINTVKTAPVQNNVQVPKNPSESIKVTNKSSVASRLTNLKNNGSKSFAEICSKKPDFNYKHVQTPQVTVKSCAKDSSRQSFGEAMNMLYKKLFNSDQNKVETPSNNQVADCDSMDWEPDDAEFSLTILETEKKKMGQEMYIIVDTNIFLDSLTFLENIVSYDCKDGVKPVIYVPWMVFNELDFIKDNRTSGMKNKACKAIDFINKMLINRESKLIGQSIYEANNQMYVGKSPDDKITSCCLQVKEKGINTVLLSNDKNLRNKLIVHGVPSLSCNDLLTNFSNIEPDNNSPATDKIEKLFGKMSDCCSVIIKDCCEEAYGPIWNKLALLEEQPWSFKVCLDIFKKYWSAVFREKLLKQCLKNVEKMISDLKNPGSLKYPEAFESFAKDCLSLCFFLMDIEQHKVLIAETTKEINLMVKLK